MKLQTIFKGILKEEEDKAQLSALDQAMSSGFNLMGSELKAKEDELQADVEQSDIQINESLTVISIIGILLAAPKVLELVVKSFAKVVRVFKSMFPKGQAKNPEQQEDIAHKLIEGLHKWHKAYIKGLKWVLKVTGAFKKAGITDETSQQKAAELVYYTLVACLAVYSGIGAYSAFKGALAGSAHGGSFSLAALEAAMASVKTAEVGEFALKLGLKA